MSLDDLILDEPKPVKLAQKSEDQGPDGLRPGDYIKEHGPVIPHVMRSGYIGKLICFDVSTESMELYKVGILEDYYIPWSGTWRAIIYTGQRQRSLVTFYSGRGAEIWEVDRRKDGKEENTMRMVQ